ASQVAFLERLVTAPGIDWGAVEMFHLDEYIALPATHPASFRRYLLERLIRPAGITRYHLLDGNADPAGVCRDVGRRLQDQPVDVAFAGIGENAHLAFNDPPADFDTEKPYLIVNLDEPCRKQQMNEGWFATLEDVPKQAISMSVKQIMKSKHIICSVPDQRKAIAVKNSLENEISTMFPASILQTHPDCTYYLDQPSASLLSKSDS
ncbi:MAG: glucosamine-6-phosphate deaminase, partial [Dyadobacter sp.]